MAGLEPEVRADGTTPAAANEPAVQPADESTAEQGPDAERAPGAHEVLKAALEAAQAKANEHYELYLRARAEMENARRRAQEEIAKAPKFAIEGFAEALVPVADSLEKALEVQSATIEGMREGVQITLRQLRAAFEKHRLAEINPVGEKFDPHRHQAIATVPVPPEGGVAPGHVVAVLQKGWTIADRVLRPALVTVAQDA